MKKISAVNLPQKSRNYPHIPFEVVQLNSHIEHQSMFPEEDIPLIEDIDCEVVEPIKVVPVIEQPEPLGDVVVHGVIELSKGALVLSLWSLILPIQIACYIFKCVSIWMSTPLPEKEKEDLSTNVGNGSTIVNNITINNSNVTINQQNRQS